MATERISDYEWSRGVAHEANRQQGHTVRSLKRGQMMGEIRLSADQFTRADQSNAASNAANVVADDVGDYQSPSVTTDNITQLGGTPAPFDDTASDGEQPAPAMD